jgi:hypothetical protein
MSMNARVTTPGSARTALRAGAAAPEPAGLVDTTAGLPRSTSTPLTMSADSAIATVHCVVASVSPGVNGSYTYGGECGIAT